jgi:thermostable 8-oxoguanine DNA glycosylase
MTTIIKSRVPRSGKLKVSRWLANLDPKVVKSYTRYWNSITPKTQDERFWFWIFAHLTVQQGWAASVKAFNHVKPLGINYTERQVLKALRASRTGLYAKKSPELVAFRDLYCSGNGFEFCDNNHSLSYHRDLLVNVLEGKGIGQAKVSLALSMIHPNQTNIICIDRHIQRWYEVPDEVGLNVRLYNEIEDHFVNACVKLSILPGMAREMYWDSLQGFGNTRYWSYVLESANVRNVLGPPPEESDTRKQARNRRKQVARGSFTTAHRQAKEYAEIEGDREQLEKFLALYQRLEREHRRQVGV